MIGISRLPESDIELFESYVLQMTASDKSDDFGLEFYDYIENPYVKSREGYKSQIAEETRELINDCFSTIADQRPTDEKLLDFGIKLLSKRQNLVVGQVIGAAEKKLTEPTDKKYAADVVYSVFREVNPQKAYNAAGEYFGYTFSLLGYLFFARNPQKYLPIVPEKFDKLFDLIGREYILCPKLSRHGDWETYSSFLNCVNDISLQLSERYGRPVTLLETHSFLWMLITVKQNPLGHCDSIDSQMSQKVKDTYACVKARIGQGEYRNKMLEIWGGKCSVTGCDDVRILKASHAKPWRECDRQECRDPYNGLLLTPNLDDLFDRNLIAFSDSGDILISNSLSWETREKLGISGNLCLRKVFDKNKPYLKYQRERLQ